MLLFLGVNNVFAQQYKYLTPPPSDIGKNAEVTKLMGLADWTVTIIIAGFMIVCGITAGNHFKQKQYQDAAGPIIAIIVVSAVVGFAVLK